MARLPVVPRVYESRTFCFQHSLGRRPAPNDAEAEIDEAGVARAVATAQTEAMWQAEHGIHC